MSSIILKTNSKTGYEKSKKIFRNTNIFGITPTCSTSIIIKTHWADMICQNGLCRRNGHRQITLFVPRLSRDHLPAYAELAGYV